MYESVYLSDSEETRKFALLFAIRNSIKSFRLILTRENLRTQQLCADVVMTVLDAAQYSIILHDNDKSLKLLQNFIGIFF